MPEERKQHNPQGQGGQQQQGGGGQEGQELKPKPGRGREQHQFESENYQPQPGHGSPEAAEIEAARLFGPTEFQRRALLLQEDYERKTLPNPKQDRAAPCAVGLQSAVR